MITRAIRTTERRRGVRPLGKVVQGREREADHRDDDLGSRENRTRLLIKPTACPVRWGITVNLS